MASIQARPERQAETFDRARFAGIFARNRRETRSGAVFKTGIGSAQQNTGPPDQRSIVFLICSAIISLRSPTKVVDVFDGECFTTIKVGVGMNRRSLALKQLPPMELSMMHILWEHGPSQVQQIRDRLEGDPAYTTVQTVLNKMERKGRVKRSL